MNKKLIYFCISSAILLFSILVFFLAPAINGLIPKKEWNEEACQYYVDTYNGIKNDDSPENENEIIEAKEYKRFKDRCYQRKAMMGLEYSAYVLNILFGLVCTFLGFLYFMDIPNISKIGKIIGLIGLFCGIIGFVLTFVYVIESGLVFDSPASKCILCQAENGFSDYKFRIDNEGRYLKYENGRYKCIFYDKDVLSSLYLKYSDYGNKYLGYYEDYFDYFDGECHVDTSIDYHYCREREEGRVSEPKIDNCDNLFYDYSSVNENLFSNPYKYIYDQWLTTLIFSCFIFIFHIGLAVFGFLLFREENETNEKTSPVVISDSNKNI